MEISSKVVGAGLGGDIFPTPFPPCNSWYKAGVKLYSHPLWGALSPLNALWATSKLDPIQVHALH